MEKKRFILWVILLHLPYFIYQCIRQQYFLTDSHEYLLEANNILDSFTAYASDLNETINVDLYTKRPLLYPLFLILGGLQPIVISLLQIALSVTSIAYLREGMLKIGYSNEKDKWFLMLLAGSISYFIYSQMVMSEILLAAILHFFVYYNILLFTSYSVNRLFIVQALLILGFLTKPVLFPFSFAYFLFLLIVFRKRWSIKFIGVAIIPLLVILSIHFINLKRTNVFHFSSIQRINLLDYNTKYYHTNTFGNDYAEAFNDSIKQISNHLSYAKKYQMESQVAKSEMTKSLFSYAVFHIKGSIRYFLDPGRFDIFNFFGETNSDQVGFLKVINEDGLSGVFSYLKKQNIFLLILLAVSLLFNGIRFIGLLFFSIKTLRKPNTIYMLILLLVGYFAAVTGPIGASRFVVPIIIILNFITLLVFTKHESIR